MVGPNYFGLILPVAKPFKRKFYWIKDNLDRKLQDESVNCISEKPSYDENIIYAACYS